MSSKINCKTEVKNSVRYNKDMGEDEALYLSFEDF